MRKYELEIENNEIIGVETLEEIDGEYQTVNATLFIPKNITQIDGYAVADIYPDDITA